MCLDASSTWNTECQVYYLFDRMCITMFAFVVFIIQTHHEKSFFFLVRLILTTNWFWFLNIFFFRFCFSFKSHRCCLYFRFVCIRAEQWVFSIVQVLIIFDSFELIDFADYASELESDNLSLIERIRDGDGVRQRNGTHVDTWRQLITFNH